MVQLLATITRRQGMVRAAKGVSVTLFTVRHAHRALLLFAYSAAAVAQLAIDAAMDWLNELALRWLDDPWEEWADGEGAEAMERLR